MRANLLSFLLVFVVSVTTTFAQERTISGRVVDEDGGGLPGVNVILKGTTTGTTTDIDGNYKVNVPAEANTLTFSFIGLSSQEVAIGARSTIDVTMSADVKQLSEVVVTAIGIEREKKALGYAVSDISGDALKQRAEPDPIRALSGKVPGVNIIGSGGGVGQATNITIRGSSSLTGNNQPLFVVDGVPFDNSTTRTNDAFGQGNPQSNRAFDIDPNNIESMTVLKGASAAALYGSRAANGVIVITTKASARGQKKGLEVTYNTSYNVEQNAMNLDKQDVWTQGALFGSHNFVFNNGFFGTWGPKYEWVNEMIQSGFTADIMTETLGGSSGIRNPLFNKYGSNPASNLYAADQYPSILNPVDRVYADTDNFNNFWQDGKVIEHAVQVSSGGENTSLTAGVSRTHNEGIIPFSEITRTSMNFGGRAQLANGLFLNGSITYVNTEQRTAQQGAEIASANAGTGIIGMLYLMSPTYDLTNNPYVNNRTGGSIYYRNGFDNPYWVAEFAPIISSVNRYFGNATVGYEFFDWLTVTYKFGFNAYTDRRSSIVPAGSENFPVGQYSIDDIFREEIDGNLLISLEKDLSSDINLRALIGHNANERSFEQTTIVGNGIIARGIDRITNTSSQLMRRDERELQRFQGVFADISVSFRDWAFVNIVGRNDWSSTLPLDNRSFFYPGISTSFVLSEAVTLPSVINFAKIRAGITKVGNEAAPYQTQTAFLINDQYTNLQFPFGNSSGLFNIANQDEDLGSPTLKPEFTTEYEVGMEVTLLNNKIGLDLTYYNRQSTDQIIEVDVPNSTGFASKITNIGRVDNFGWEIGLDLTPIELSNGFKWNIYTAYTRNRNEVVDIGDAEQILAGGFASGGQSIVHRPGLPFGQILGTEPQRDPETGAILVNPLDGKPFDNNELQIIGDPNPNYTVGVTNSFSWKGISVSVLIDYQDGGDIYSVTADQTLSRGILNHPLNTDRAPKVGIGFLGDGAGGVLLDESGNKIPNNVLTTANDWVFATGWAAGGSDWASVYDATTIRIREVSLAYNFPAVLLEKTPFGSARVSFSGRNLWYDAVNFPDALDFDPEVSGLGAGDTSGAFRGFDFMGIPSTRRYGVNLSVTF
ncbi:MAG: SusC/RagA family TonB-linked outer membrane protein [Cyclobacteriaceae bacterium]